MQDTGERFIPSKELTVTGLEHWHRYMSILEYLENKKVLDIACGSGYGSFLMADKRRITVSSRPGRKVSVSMSVTKPC